MSESPKVTESVTPSVATLGYQDDSYDAWIASLEPCPGCGVVDVMDNIEGAPLCAACFLDGMDGGEWDEFGDDEELRS